MESETKPEETHPTKDDIVLLPPDRNNACASAVDDPAEVNTDSGNDSGDDRAIFIPLDILAKGTPPPSTGGTSPGRNHDVVSSEAWIPSGNDGVSLLVVTEKSTPPPCTGDSSSGRKEISRRDSIRVSSSSHGVKVLKAQERGESTPGGDGSNPNHEDN